MQPTQRCTQEAYPARQMMSPSRLGLLIPLAVCAVALMVGDSGRCDHVTDLKIAIIGAGPAGLLTARELRKAGFRSIDLFEKGAKVAALVHSFFVDGVLHDLGTAAVPTHFYPADRSSYAMFPPYAELLEEMNVTFLPYERPISGVRDYPNRGKAGRPMQYPFNVNFREPQLDLVKDLVQLLGLTEQVMNSTGIQGVYQSGVSEPGQNFEQWALAHNMTQFVEFWSQLGSKLGFGSGRDIPASLFLLNLKHGMTSILKLYAKLLNVAAGSPELAGPEHAYARFVLGDPDPQYFSWTTDGMQQFMDRIAATEERFGAAFHLNSEVTRVRIDRSTKKVELQIKGDPSNEPHVFDVVVVATRPRQAVEFLPRVHPARGMLEGVHTGRYNFVLWNQSAIAEVWPSEWSDKKGLQGTIDPMDSAIHLGEAGHPRLGPCQPFVIGKREPSQPILYSHSYYGDELTAEQCLANQIRGINHNGFPMDESDVLGFERHEYPVRLTLEQEADGWYEDFFAFAQGWGSVYFTGELFAGTGVQAVVDYTISWVPELIADLSEKCS